MVPQMEKRNPYRKDSIFPFEVIVVYKNERYRWPCNPVVHAVGVADKKLVVFHQKHTSGGAARARRPALMEFSSPHLEIKRNLIQQCADGLIDFVCRAAGRGEMNKENWIVVILAVSEMICAKVSGDREKCIFGIIKFFYVFVSV
ncbi:hypothetical protein EVAR_44373_1 [Eumeta japonica]|uniref:Uncharacterized protein n=1 Tax=Eumeta variegata TaxID=151549 RepID=A0A4C1X7I7_EUMVA|nr:hypothetical protein EVAR_44373_1 [Eumeta japonica]